MLSIFGRVKAFFRRIRMPATRKRPGQVHVRPYLEALEDRTVLSTLIVTNNNDSGPGSLRDKIASASSNDMIIFDLNLAGQTITLTSGPLNITKNLDIENTLTSPVSISGNNASGVFVIDYGKNVTIAALLIVN